VKEVLLEYMLRIRDIEKSLKKRNGNNSRSKTVFKFFIITLLIFYIIELLCCIFSETDCLYGFFPRLYNQKQLSFECLILWKVGTSAPPYSRVQFNAYINTANKINFFEISWSIGSLGR